MVTISWADHLQMRTEERILYRSRDGRSPKGRPRKLGGWTVSRRTLKTMCPRVETGAEGGRVAKEVWGLHGM